MNLKRTVTFAAAALISFVSFAQQQEEPDFYELAEKETERLPAHCEVGGLAALLR